MPVTTIKRFQSDRHWYWTLENCNVEVCDEPNTGLTLKYYDDNCKEGRAIFSMSKEDALFLAQAMRELFPFDIPTKIN
jgi:hypothetical protein